MNEIIVGVDGSGHSLAAVEWAAEEAVRRSTDLRIVYALPPWYFDIPCSSQAGVVHQWLHGAHKETLDKALVLARGLAPEVAVTARAIEGDPAVALLRVAKGAQLLVMGGRGLGELTCLLVGSVSRKVVAHAPCPVAVIRSPRPGVRREVVVGVDGSANSAAAIGFAFEEAKLRQAKLHAVLAWTCAMPAGLGTMMPLVYDPNRVLQDEEELLTESLATWREEYPDVEVIADAVEARPVSALSEAAERADLLVVGTRGRGGFAGLLLGSVGHAVLHHTECPVIVVPSAITS